MHTVHTQSFAELLQSAVEEPGTLSAAYQQFHSYSLGCSIATVVRSRTRRVASRSGSTRHPETRIRTTGPPVLAGSNTHEG